MSSIEPTPLTPSDSGLVVSMYPSGGGVVSLPISSGGPAIPLHHSSGDLVVPSSASSGMTVPGLGGHNSVPSGGLLRSGRQCQLPVWQQDYVCFVAGWFQKNVNV
ncbi:UNVERIFIED_CONTAM: hypothetical protein FKN15_076682 [Acipenser sinensis]